MANRTKVTPKKRSEFLAELCVSGNVTKAAAVTAVSRQEWYRERDANADFAKAWEEAVEIGVEALEDEARRRAYDGVEEPVFHKGEEVARVRKYSDVLLMFLIKAHKPEKYRERVDQNITGDVVVRRKVYGEADGD